MEIHFQPQIRRFIDEQLNTGRYGSVEDLVNAGVARLQAEQELTAEEIDELRADLDVGLAEADRGEFVEFTAEEIIAERRAAHSKRSEDH